MSFIGTTTNNMKDIKTAAFKYAVQKGENKIDSEMLHGFLDGATSPEARLYHQKNMYHRKKVIAFAEYVAANPNCNIPAVLTVWMDKRK